MATKRLSGWGELLEAQNRRYEAETERMRVTKEDITLFICYINVKKTVDISPGEQAIILLAQSASDAENKARQFERDSNNGKSWGWPIKSPKRSTCFARRRMWHQSGK